MSTRVPQNGPAYGRDISVARRPLPHRRALSRTAAAGIDPLTSRRCVTARPRPSPPGTTSRATSSSRTTTPRSPSTTTTAAASGSTTATSLCTARRASSSVRILRSYCLLERLLMAILLPIGPTKQVPATRTRVYGRHRACPGQIAHFLFCFFIFSNLAV